MECDGILNVGGGAGLKLVNRCFQLAVEHLLPGHGDDFALRIEHNGGAHGQVDGGAERENARIDYVPCFTTAGGSIDLGRGGVNVPWGNKLTPVHVPSAEERAMIDASMAVIVEKLGLESTAAPRLVFVSAAGGG